MKAEDQFVATLMDDLSKGRLELPTLPEVAMKVRDMVDDPFVPVEKLAKLINTDAALSARLLQLANSVFFRGLSTVDNVHTAVVRLGNICVRNVVASLVVRQLYQQNEIAVIKNDLRALWLHGAKVAAISHMLAKRFTDLNSDEAMLAGLIHDIGTLPILKRAIDFPDVLKNRAALQRVITQLHTDIGKLILEDWHFPQELTTVAAQHEDLKRDTSPLPDYTDVVIIANLHSYTGIKNNKFAQIDWNEIPAFSKLELTPEQSIAIIAEARQEIAEAQKILSS